MSARVRGLSLWRTGEVMYVVWTQNQIDDAVIVLADIPTHALAERLVKNLGRIYPDAPVWLEGNLASQPGYQANCGPEKETRELIPALARANRAGFLTDCSQPGEKPTRGWDGAIWRQRAAVSGFASPQLAERLARAAHDADLMVQITTTTGREHLDDRIRVTTCDWETVTGFGGRRSRRDLAFQYHECSTAAINAVCDAVQVTIVDPEWGRNTALWPLLDDLAAAGD